MALKAVTVFNGTLFGICGLLVPLCHLSVSMSFMFTYVKVV